MIGKRYSVTNSRKHALTVLQVCYTLYITPSNLLETTKILYGKLAKPLCDQCRSDYAISKPGQKFISRTKAKTGIDSLSTIKFL